MPQRYKVGDKTYNIPDDRVNAFLADFPDAAKIDFDPEGVTSKIQPEQSDNFFDILKKNLAGNPLIISPLSQIRSGALIETIGRTIGETVAENVVPEKLTVPSISRGGKPIEDSEMASNVVKIGVGIAADPLSYIGGPLALKGIGKVGKFVKGLRGTEKIVSKIDDVAIPIFGAANKTEDALKLGLKLKGNKEGIARLKFLEDKFAKEFDAVKKTGDFDELAITAHKKSLYREAREVATGEGGAAEFVAKEAKAKPLDNLGSATDLGKPIKYPKAGEFLREEIGRERFIKEAIKNKSEIVYVDETGKVAKANILEQNVQPELFENGLKLKDSTGKIFITEASQVGKSLDKQFGDIVDEYKTAISIAKRYEGPKEVSNLQSRLNKIIKNYKGQVSPLENIAKGTEPLDNIEQLGQSALRRDPLMESIIRKDPDMIAAKRGVGIPKEKIDELAPKLTTEEAQYLDATLNTGGALTGRKTALELTNDLDNIINKSLEGTIDPKVGDVLGVRAERGRGLQNLKADNEVILNTAKDILNKIKKEDPERYKLVQAEMEKVLAPVLGEGAIKLSPAQKLLRYSAEIGNIPRSIMASADLSMGFRQGLWVAPSHPKIFFKEWVKQFKMFGSEKYYQAIQNEIRNSPNFYKAQKYGLDFTDLSDIAKREESYMSNFAEKLTGGKYSFVRASGRAFTGLSNKLRMNLFDYMVDYGKKFAIGDEAKYLKSAAKYVNDATGRGILPKSIKGSAVALNTVFFSPRLLFSRLNLLNPYKYFKMDPVVRRQALKDLFKFAGMATTITGLGKMAGADVETDPRNADFMKVRIGNTRYDFLGGFQQPIRAAAQIATGQIISSTTGKEITLGEGYKPLTRIAVAARFLAMKESPLFSFGHGLMEGRNVIGEKFDVPTELMNRVVPMVAQDAYDLYKEKGLQGVGLAVPAIFGVGVQTYGGVNTWGLKATEYPALNKELLRLKTTMGFPSTSAFGKEFSVSEYKRFKNIAGKEIAKRLTDLINKDGYKEIPDSQKILIIENHIDNIKNHLKERLYRK